MRFIIYYRYLSVYIVGLLQSPRAGLALKTPFQIALVALALVTLFCMRSDASAVEDLVQKSDIVCIATLKSKTDLGADISSSALPHKIVLVTLDIKSVWKGDFPAKPFTLRAKVFDWDAFMRQGGGTVSGRGDDFTEFEPGSNYLIFAQRDKGDDDFILVNRGKVIESAWKIGPLSPDVSASASVEDNIYAQFVSTLSSADPEIRTKSLLVAAGLGGLFWDKPDPDFAQVPDTSNLIELAKTRVIPAVLRLMKSSDAQTRSNALFAAANFQLPQAIPELEAAANAQTSKSEFAAECLGLYKTRANVPALVPMLASKNATVRGSVVSALQAIGDRRALPALLAAIHDPDPDVRYGAVRALSVITGVEPNVGFPTQEDFTPKESAIDRFWQSWASTPVRKIELQQLQKQAQSEKP